MLYNMPFGGQVIFATSIVKSASSYTAAGLDCPLQYSL